MQIDGKKRLRNVSESCFKTTMIGSLEIFEKAFGYLWGHGKPEANLDDDEMYFRELWNRCRNQLLDHGHLNSRIVQDELSRYTITENRYITNFSIKEK